MGILIKGDFTMRRNTISINTIADYFLSKQKMTPKKLQKMCYYAYAWYITLYNKGLFDDGKFEAWVHGPVNVKLYQKYKMYRWTEIPNKKEPSISLELKEFLDVIFNTFSEYDGDQLEIMTHSEEPWIEARRGKDPEEAGDTIINDETIKAFYGKLMESEQLE